MTPFQVAWDTFIFYSLMGFIFCFLNLRRAPFYLLIYFIGGFIMAFSLDHTTFGVTEAEWRNDYWKNVRTYNLMSHLILSVFLISLRSFIAGYQEMTTPDKENLADAEKFSSN